MGHRPVRDKRVSTHVGLVARAFGADGIIFADHEVKKVKESLERVREEWGGSFFIKTGESWRDIAEEWQSKKGQIVHLTMYGIPINKKISKIQGKDTLIIIGAEKVPKKVYKISDFNIAIGNQPHSEIAALAVFLDHFFDGKGLENRFPDAKRRIVPSKAGKEVKKLED